MQSDSFESVGNFSIEVDFGHLDDLANMLKGMGVRVEVVRQPMGALAGDPGTIAAIVSLVMAPFTVVGTVYALRGWVSAKKPRRFRIFVRRPKVDLGYPPSEDEVVELDFENYSPEDIIKIIKETSWPRVR